MGKSRQEAKDLHFVGPSRSLFDFFHLPGNQTIKNWCQAILVIAGGGNWVSLSWGLKLLKVLGLNKQLRQRSWSFSNKAQWAVPQGWCVQEMFITSMRLKVTNILNHFCFDFFFFGQGIQDKMTTLILDMLGMYWRQNFQMEICRSNEKYITETVERCFRHLLCPSLHPMSLLTACIWWPTRCSCMYNVNVLVS